MGKMKENEKLEQLTAMTSELLADAQNVMTENRNDNQWVYKRLNVEGWGYELTDIILKVIPVPEQFAEREDSHNLELVAYYLPIEYKVSRILKTGSKHDILEVLKGEELPKRILAALPIMAEAFEDL